MMNRSFYTCMRKTTESFIKEVSALYPHIQVLDEYVNSSSRIKCKCSVCGQIWNPIPNNLLRGHGCPKCASAESAKKRAKTSAQFVKELSEINPKIEVLDNYTNNHTPISCRCLICGYEWKVKPNDLLNAHGCPSCGVVRVKENSRKSQEQFIEDLARVDSTISVIGKYKNSKTPISCRCNVCGYRWKPIPNSLLSGRGCPICSKMRQSQNATKTHEAFIEELKTVNPKIVVLGRYQKSNIKVECKCSKCHFLWEATPNALLSGTGCPKCNGKQKRSNEEFLSELESINPEIEALEPYTNSHSKIRCKCRVCGWIWNPTPTDLLITNRHRMGTNGKLTATRVAKRI